MTVKDGLGMTGRTADLVTPEESKIQKKWMFAVFAHMENMV